MMMASQEFAIADHQVFTIAKCMCHYVVQLHQGLCMHVYLANYLYLAIRKITQNCGGQVNT